MDILLPYLSRQWQINLYLVKISFNPYIYCFAKDLSHKIFNFFLYRFVLIYVIDCVVCMPYVSVSAESRGGH